MLAPSFLGTYLRVAPQSVAGRNTLGVCIGIGALRAHERLRLISVARAGTVVCSVRPDAILLTRLPPLTFESCRISVGYWSQQAMKQL